MRLDHLLSKEKQKVQKKDIVYFSMYFPKWYIEFFILIYKRTKNGGIAQFG